MFSLPPRAAERPRKTMQAASVLAAHAKAIADACAAAPPGTVILAVVGPTFEFEGAHTLPLEGLYSRVQSLDVRSWHLVFSPGTSLADVDQRCATMRGIAEARLRAVERIIERGKPPD